jgi:Family of unknown function (DUF5335)
MSNHAHELPRDEWKSLLEDMTKEHEGNDAAIELLDQQIGDESEVQRLPLAFVEYDPKDDVVVVGVGGRGPNYPVVLRHFVEHPQRILADSYGPDLTLALDILGADGSHTIVTLHEPRAEEELPP